MFIIATVLFIFAVITGLVLFVLFSNLESLPFTVDLLGKDTVAAFFSSNNGNFPLGSSTHSCVHEWSCMPIDWNSSGATCDYIRSDIPPESPRVERVINLNRSRTFASSLDPWANIMHVCNKCQTVACNGCHKIIKG